jgi:hypothetical protein
LGYAGDDGQTHQKKPQNGRRLRSGDNQGAALLRQDKEGTVSAMVKFSGVSREQATRVYNDIIGTFTRNGAVDDETQRNDLAIIRQVVNANETLPNARAYDFSFALEADQQLNRSGWKP